MENKNKIKIKMNHKIKNEKFPIINDKKINFDKI